MPAPSHSPAHTRALRASALLPTLAFMGLGMVMILVVSLLSMSPSGGTLSQPDVPKATVPQPQLTITPTPTVTPEAPASPTPRASVPTAEPLVDFAPVAVVRQVSPRSTTKTVSRAVVVVDSSHPVTSRPPAKPTKPSKPASPSTPKPSTPSTPSTPEPQPPSNAQPRWKACMRTTEDGTITRGCLGYCRQGLARSGEAPDVCIRWCRVDVGIVANRVTGWYRWCTPRDAVVARV